jgi:hypothetical protein
MEKDGAAPSVSSPTADATADTTDTEALTDGAEGEVNMPTPPATQEESPPLVSSTSQYQSENPVWALQKGSGDLGTVESAVKKIKDMESAVDEVHIFSRLR